MQGTNNKLDTNGDGRKPRNLLGRLLNTSQGFILPISKLRDAHIPETDSKARLTLQLCNMLPNMGRLETAY